MSVPADDSAYHQYYKKILSYVQKNGEESGDPQEVADLIYQLATKQHIKKLRYPIGKGIKAHPAIPIAFSLVCVGVYPEEKAIQIT